MIHVLYLLLVLGFVGAFDTLFYHEWKARLPAMGALGAKELKVHAIRDVFYAILFGTLPFFQWRGAFASILALILVAEILITFTDFVIEKEVRKPLGDVFAGERITHTIMGICYGAMLAFLVPEVLQWSKMSTALYFEPVDAPILVLVMLVVWSVGVFLSGMRDLYAAFGMPHGSWPWK